MSSAELAIGVRTTGVTSRHVRAALWRRRTLVKAWTMRGTLHLVPARDYPVYAAAAATRRHYLAKAWLKAFAITEKELRTIIDAVPKALDGACLTREELATELASVLRNKRLEARLRSGWGEFLKPAAFNGRLVFGPNKGRNVTFVRPDQWIDRWDELDPGEAMQEVARRYLRAYGPATREEFARWWGTQPPEAGRVLSSLGDEAVQVDREGDKAWMRAADVDDLLAHEADEGSVHLLPGFDQYTLTAPRNLDAVVPSKHKAAVYRTAGWVSPVILVGGRVAGTWEWTRTGNEVDVEVTPFRALPKTVTRRLAARTERVRDVLSA